MMMFFMKCIADKKAFWRSKTLWVNLIAGLALLAQNQYGFVVDGEIQGAILAIINLALRLITKEPLGFTDEAAPPGATGAPEA